MKNIFKSILVLAAAAATFASCQNEAFVEQDNLKTVNFLAGEIVTRTAFSTPSGTIYPTLWTVNDSLVKIATNGANAKDAVVTPARGGRTASFSLTMEVPVVPSFVFDAVSPASAFVGLSGSKGWNLNIPTTQTPSLNSVDEAAQILVAQSDTYSPFPENVTLGFLHFTAYGKLNLTSLPISAKISSVTLTAASNWAGRWNCSREDFSASENSASATITVKTSSSSNIWFACAPVDLGGKTIKVTVATDQGNYEKVITLPEGKKFESGKIASFSVDFAGIVPKPDVIYSLVTDTDQLTAGSEVIIVGFGENTAAMSTTQNGNNRGEASVTVTDVNKVVNPSDAVEVFKLEKGKYKNSVAFNTGDAINTYIYAASTSSNYLKSENSISANSSFEIKLGALSEASIIAQGPNTRNVLRYNESSHIFSCYGSASQKPVKLFKKEGSGTAETLINGPVEKDTKVYASLAALVAAGAPTTDGETVTVTFTDDVITKFYVNGSGNRKGVYFNVGDREVELYFDRVTVPTGWEVGGKVSGTITCPWIDYKGTWELKPDNDNGLGYTPTTPSSEYSLVTDVNTLTAGDVIVLGCASEGKAAGPLGANSYFSSVTASITNGVLTSDGAIEITLGGSAGSWTLTTSEGQITASKAKALVLNTGSNKTCTITITDGAATISFGSFGTIQYNASSPRFLNYTSAQTSIEIYKKR